MTENRSGSDCDSCGLQGQTFPTKAILVRKIRFLKIPFSRQRVKGIICHGCGHFEEGDYDGDC